MPSDGWGFWRALPPSPSASDSDHLHRQGRTASSRDATVGQTSRSSGRPTDVGTSLLPLRATWNDPAITGARRHGPARPGAPCSPRSCAIRIPLPFLWYEAIGMSDYRYYIDYDARHPNRLLPG